MTERRLYPPDTVPDYTTAAWYAGRDSAPHLEQPLHAGRLDAASHHAATAADLGCTTAVDLGAGDGGLLSVIAGDFDRCWGYDLQPSNVVAAAARGARVSLADVTAEPIEWGDLAIATEMLEHLIDPHRLVRSMRAHCRMLVASSPWNETEGDAYGYHAWAWDHDGYRAMLEGAGWSVIRHETVDIFQVVLAQ